MSSDALNLPDAKDTIKQPLSGWKLFLLFVVIGVCVFLIVKYTVLPASTTTTTLSPPLLPTVRPTSSLPTMLPTLEPTLSPATMGPTIAPTTSPIAVCYQPGEMDPVLAQMVYDLFPEMLQNPYTGLTRISSVEKVYQTENYVIENVRCKLSYWGADSSMMIGKHHLVTLTVKHDLNSCDYPVLLGVSFEDDDFPNFGVGCWYNLSREPQVVESLRSLFNAYYYPKQFVKVDAITPLNIHEVSLNLTYLDDHGITSSGIFTYRQTQNCTGLSIEGGHQPVYTTPPAPTFAPIVLPGMSGTLVNQVLPANVKESEISFLYGDWWIDQSRGYVITFDTNNTFRYFADTGSYNHTTLFWSAYPSPLTLSKLNDNQLVISYLLPRNSKWPVNVRTKLYYAVWNRKV